MSPETQADVAVRRYKATSDLDSFIEHKSTVADATGLPMVASQVWTDIALIQEQLERVHDSHSSFMDGIERDPTELLDKIAKVF